jgi:Tfp pilus assembly protein PilV
MSRRSESGATLIETVVALTLFMFVILGFANSVINAGVTGDSSRRRAQSTMLASAKIEQLRPLPASSAELIAGTHADGNNPLKGNGKKGGRFTRTWEVTDDVPVAGMKRVEVRVSWQDPGHTRKVTLVTYVSPI